MFSWLFISWRESLTHFPPIFHARTSLPLDHCLTLAQVSLSQSGRKWNMDFEKVYPTPRSTLWVLHIPYKTTWR